MQIKRFEATDMTEALRMVKCELGDDAVILSAKEVRPGGFFSALREKSVEITAAADYPADGSLADDSSANHGLADHSPADYEFSGLLSKHLAAESQNDRVSLSSPPQAIKPFAWKARPFSHQSTAPQNHRLPADRRDPMQEQGLISDDVESELETKICRGAGEASNAALIRYVENKHLVAEPFYRDATGQKVIALVGPPGVGKSITLAKLARHCLMVEKKRTGLISLDRFRIAANDMLENVARIMNLPLTIVHEADKMQSALNDLADVDVVLIDTPGMGGMDSAMMEAVSALLCLAKPDETHLVVNATVRDDVLAATAKTFLPLGADHVLFTHMDEYGQSAAVMNLLKKSRLPSAFYGDGVDLFDHLQETTLDKLAGYCPTDDPTRGQVTVFPTTRGRKQLAAVSDDFSSDSIHYVANRNSELFHQPTCKSIKRIDAQNIAAFNSVEQAMQEGFKPCRACCDYGMIGKSVTVALGQQRMSAI